MTIFDRPLATAASGCVRVFETGANRDVEGDKLDFDGFFSPLVMEAFAEYMHYNRTLRDGTIRDSDNWQKGFPLDVLRKSLWRHFFDVWRNLRGYPSHENLVWGCCAILFNVQGILHQALKSDPDLLACCKAEMLARRLAKFSA